MATLTPPYSRSASIEIDEQATSKIPLHQNQCQLSELDGFHRLVEDLSSMLENSSGNTIADVDPSKIIRRMEEYTSDEGEWSKYAFEDLSRGYTRNLVDAGKGKGNLLVLVWTPGKGSPIHDHADAHCVMKVIKGTLKESRFSWPLEDCTEPMKLTSQKILQCGDVAYMSDTLGLHRISNPDVEQTAVSLHLYTPPNAAIHGCDIFDEKTGKSTHVQQCSFYSEYGVKK